MSDSPEYTTHDDFDAHMRQLAKEYGFEYESVRPPDADREHELFLLGRSDKFRSWREARGPLLDGDVAD